MTKEHAEFGSGDSKRYWATWILAVAFFAIVVWLIGALRSVLAPFVAAAIMAYILNPLVTKIESDRIGRSFASMLAMLLAVAMMVAFFLVVAPIFVSQARAMFERAPAFLDWVNDRAIPWVNHTLNADLTMDRAFFADLIRKTQTQIRENLVGLTSFAASSGTTIAFYAGLTALLPFLLYYFLRDWESWSTGFRRYIPDPIRPRVEKVLTSLDEVLGEFLRGQLTVMLIMGFVYGLGLMLVGLDSGFAIGLVAGILVFVPYLGAFTGLLLATLAALLQFGTWGGLLAVWAVFVVGQTLESYIVTPKLVGERIGLSPLAVIFALMAFGKLLGFVGMLLALPMAAICLVLFREMSEIYLGSRFYRRGFASVPDGGGKAVNLTLDARGIEFAPALKTGPAEGEGEGEGAVRPKYEPAFRFVVNPTIAARYDGFEAARRGAPPSEAKPDGRGEGPG